MIVIAELSRQVTLSIKVVRQSLDGSNSAFHHTLPVGFALKK
jgi:hypothetical protein